MRDQEWDSALAELDALDLAKLVLSLLGLDAVDGEAALGVVDETEVLASLLNGDDVHEAGRVGDVGADLAVDLDQALHEDGLGLAVVEGILEAVADEHDQGHAVAELVRTGRGLGSVGSGQLVQEPVGGGAKALLVLLAARLLASPVFVEMWFRGGWAGDRNRKERNKLMHCQKKTIESPCSIAFHVFESVINLHSSGHCD